MSEAASPPEGISRRSRFSGKGKWKEKLLSSEGWRKNAEEHESNETEVKQFLQNAASAGPRAKDKPSVAANNVFREASATVADAFVERHVGLQGKPWPPPKLDTTTVQTHPIALPESDLSPIKDVYQRPKPRMNKGLFVRFATTPPVLIGEGGDEAQLPPRDLAISISHQDTDHGVKPAFLKRSSTGLGIPDHPEITAPGRNRQDDELLGPKPSEWEIETDQVREIHGVLMARLQETNTSTSNDLPVSTLNLIPDQRARSGLHEVDHPDPGIGANNSLTPLPSPMPPVRDQSRPAQSYEFPAVDILENNPSTTPKAPISIQQRDVQDSQTSREKKTFSIRNVAKSLGDDALHDFDMRMRSVYDIFRSSASTQEASITFCAWTLSAAWWFIKGRMELENAVRNRSKNLPKADMLQASQPARSLVQAYIDLAKAWWIVKEIIPVHPEMMKYGNASISSMTAIVESFGDRRLAQLVQSNVEIIANLRALTMSMKRNNTLPPGSCDTKGSDLRILLDHPRLSASIVQLVCNDCQGSPIHAEGFPIPVGDTTRHFVLSRMFGRLCPASRHGGSDETRLTCLISMMQSKMTGKLEIFIASQDGQVNFAIRTEKETASDYIWDKVQRVLPLHAILLPASQKIDLKITFQETDFWTFCAICDQSSGVYKDFGKREDENLVFECTLGHFERLEMPNEPGGFPQGSIEDCKSRLYARKKVVAAGNGRRVIHQGYRLVILTPPTLKHIRILSAAFNGDQAVLFNYWLQEAGLTLTLRRPESPSLLLAFRNQEDLHSFCTMMSSRFTTKDDILYPPLSMRGFYIAGCSAEGDVPAERKETLCRLQWRQLQLVQRGRTIPGILSDTSPSRIIIDCGSGSFVDYMALG